MKQEASKRYKPQELTHTLILPTPFFDARRSTSGRSLRGAPQSPASGEHSWLSYENDDAGDVADRHAAGGTTVGLASE